MKITFPKYRHNFGLSRGKIWLFLLKQTISFYFEAESGQGRGRVWGGGGGGVVGTCWLFSVHVSWINWGNWSYLPPNILFGPILTLNWACLVWHFLLLKRMLKAPEGTKRAMEAQKVLQPSAGGRRRGLEGPKLLVFKILEEILWNSIHPLNFRLNKYLWNNMRKFKGQL